MVFRGGNESFPGEVVDQQMHILFRRSIPSEPSDSVDGHDFIRLDGRAKFRELSNRSTASRFVLNADSAVFAEVFDNGVHILEVVEGSQFLRQVMHSDVSIEFVDLSYQFVTEGFGDEDALPVSQTFEAYVGFLDDVFRVADNASI